MEKSTVINDQIISVHTTAAVHCFSPMEIIRCQAKSNYTWFHLTGKRKLLVAKTLGKFETILTQNNFIRIHQTDIVNRSYISSIKKYGVVCLIDGTCLSISRRRMSRVHKMITF